MGVAFISFYMPERVRRPILALVSYFEQFYRLSSGLLEVRSVPYLHSSKKKKNEK